MTYSFVVIAFNEEKTIQNTITHIFKQTGLENFEVIIVNDDSTDQTKQLVEKLQQKHPQIKLLTNDRNRGRGYSRKVGVNQAKGKYICFVDADIEIPANWLQTCKAKIEKADAVGGIAVPDGDACYIYRVFQLQPKIAHHTVSVSGGNGMFKRQVLEAISYDEQMHNGEDVDLTWKMDQHGFISSSIPDLVCKHQEHKSFVQTCKWMFEQGKGANALLKKFGKVRLPDLTFIALLIQLGLIVVFGYFYPVLLLMPIGFVAVVALLHILKKFQVTTPLVWAFPAVLMIHSVMIASYFFGRIAAIKTLL